jgi:hypothetical protein
VARDGSLADRERTKTGILVKRTLFLNKRLADKTLCLPQRRHYKHQ